MSAIQFEVKQSDIDNGQPNRCDKCALTLALQRHFMTSDVVVTRGSAYINDQHYTLGDGAVKFVYHFDRYFTVTPGMLTILPD